MATIKINELKHELKHYQDALIEHKLAEIPDYDTIRFIQQKIDSIIKYIKENEDR